MGRPRDRACHHRGDPALSRLSAQFVEVVEKVPVVAPVEAARPPLWPVASTPPIISDAAEGGAARTGIAPPVAFESGAAASPEQTAPSPTAGSVQSGAVWALAMASPAPTDTTMSPYLTIVGV